MSFVHHHAPAAMPAPTDTCVVIQGDRLLAAPDISHAVALPEFGVLRGTDVATEKPVHIGLIAGRSCWLFPVDSPETAAPAGWQWHETRTLLTILAPTQLHAVNCARQLLWWDRRHRFCGVCGTPTIEVVEERARRCPKCHATFFPVASPAIIVAVTRGDELLLAHNRNFRAGMFSLLAGFVDPGETIEQAVAREVREEVGIEIDEIRYVTSQPWPYPNSLMLGFRARYVSGDLRADGVEIVQAAWYRPDALPDIPRLGSVARHLIEQWRQRA